MREIWLRLLLLWPAFVLLAALVGLVVALGIGGGADPLLVDDPGPGVRWGLPVAQLLLQLSASVCIGALVVAVLVLPPTDAAWGRLLDAATVAAATWTVAAAMQAFLLYMALGPPIGSATFGPNLVLFVSSTGSGWLAATIAAALLTTLAVAFRSYLAAAGLLLAAALSLLPIVLQGHAASAGGDHGVAVSALGLHVLAAAVWVGGLGWTLWLARRHRGEHLRVLVGRYSTVALLAFCVVAGSGVLSATVRVGTVANLSSPYGVLLLMKTLALFTAGVLGWLHRRRTLPTIGTGRRGAFLRLAAVEVLVLAVAIGLAAGLSVTPSPGSDGIARTAAEILTGRALPPPPQLMSLLTQWRADPWWLTVGSIGGAFYLTALAGLRRRGMAWPWTRTMSFVAGVVLLLWVTNGPLNRYQEVLAGAQVVSFATLLLVVPLLLVGGAPLAAAEAAFLPRHDGTLGGRDWLLLVTRSGPLARLMRPLPAMLLLLLAGAVPLSTPVLSWSTTDPLGHAVVTTALVLIGLIFTCTMQRANAARPDRGTRLAILGVLMTAVAGYAAALLLRTGPLLPGWYGAMGWDLDLLATQRAGTIAALIISESALVVNSMILLFRHDAHVAGREIDPRPQSLRS